MRPGEGSRQTYTAEPSQGGGPSVCPGASHSPQSCPIPLGSQCHLPVSMTPEISMPCLHPQPGHAPHSGLSHSLNGSLPLSSPRHVFSFLNQRWQTVPYLSSQPAVPPTAWPSQAFYITLHPRVHLPLPVKCSAVPFCQKAFQESKIILMADLLSEPPWET